MKKIIISMLAVILVMICVLGVVACTEKKDTTNPLNTFSYEVKKYYDSDFTLPAKIGNYDLTWESDNAAIVLTKREDNWLATVVRPDEGTVSVTLKVTANGYSKEYKTSVAAIEVSDIIEAYDFKQNRQIITNDFALDQEATFKGKTATIVWTVEDEDSKEYISISDDGKTCLVNQSTVMVDVKIKATFTYNGESASLTYTMTVYMEMDPMQMVDYWYNNTGVSMVLSGYLVEIAIEYSEQYGNISLYMVNDDLTAGYYLFRVKTDSDTAAKLVPGVHVTATGTTNTNYNGLIETNAGGNLVVDEDIDPIDLSTTVAAIDDLVVGNLPAAIYNQSRLVSLTNWEVSSVWSSAPAADKTATLFILSKGNATVSIAVSKYMEGAYKAAEGDAKWESICALREQVKVGDIVSLVGVLSNYNGHQICLIDAADVTIGGTKDPADTVYAGQKVATALAAVNAAVKAAGADKLLTADVEFNLPETNGDVTMTYTLCGTSRSVVLDGNNVAVKVGKKDSATIRVDYKVGDFETVQFIKITSDGEYEEPEPEPGPEPGPEEENVLATFNLGDDGAAGHVDGTAVDGTYTETVGAYTLTLTDCEKVYSGAIDEKGNGCLKLGTSSAFASFKFTVADGVQYVEIYVAKYKSYSSSVKVNGVQYDLTKNSNDGEYEVITVDVTENKTVTVETCNWDGDTYFNGRCMINTIKFLGNNQGGGDEPEPGPEPDPDEEDVLATFNLGDDGDATHDDGTAVDGTYTETVNGYTLTLTGCEKVYSGARDAQGNGCLKLGTSSAYATLTFTVADDVQCVKIYVAKYKTYSSSLKVNGVQYDLTKNSNDGEYEVIIVDVSTNKTVTLETCNWDGDTYFNGRCMINKIEFLADNQVGGDEPEPGPVDPEPNPDGKVVTIAEALEIADGTKVIVTGVVIRIDYAWSDANNNMSVTIGDGEGHELYIFKLATKVGIGDTITVTGTKTTYNGKIEIDAGATATIDQAHECTDFTEADCNNAGTCKVCGKENPDMPALGHDDDDNDGLCDRCGKDMNPAEGALLASFTFGENGDAAHVDGKADDTYSATVDGYTLSLTGSSKVFSGAYDMTGNSCLKLGTTSVAGGFTFTVAEDVKTVKIYIAGYKAKDATVTINGTAYTLKSHSDDGQYDCIEIDVSTLKTVTLEVTSGFRAMIDTIEFWS